MSSNSVTLKSGDTISGLVKAKYPDASPAELRNKTQAVLDANGLNWDSAKRLPVGKEINLEAAGGGAQKPTPANTAQGAETPAGGGDLMSLIQQFIKMQGQTNPFGGTGSGSGLDTFLNGAGKNLSGNALAARSGNFTFGLAGGDVLGFANPSIILGNLGLKA